MKGYNTDMAAHSASSVLDTDLLREASVLGKMQHHRLRGLAQDLDNAEQRTLNALGIHVQEMSRLAEENKALRLQVTTLSAELAALSQTENASEHAFNELSKRLSAAESKLIERDQRLAELEPLINRLPTENQNLLEERKELLVEVDQLREKLASMQPLKRFDEYKEQLQDLQHNLASQQSILRSSHRNREVAIIAEKNSLLLETQNWEQTLTTNHQREEIRRLYCIIEALNREKALIPPTVLAVSGSFIGKDMVPDSMNELTYASKDDIKKIMDYFERLEASRNEQLSTEGLRGGLALQQMRAVDEQTNLLSNLLSVIDDIAGRQTQMLMRDSDQHHKQHGLFYFAPVLHAYLEQSKESGESPRRPPGFTKRFLGAKAGELSIYHLDEPDIPLHILEVWKTSVALDKDKLQIILKYRPLESQAPQVHVIKLGSPDEFNRWFHALKYAGFLPNDISKYFGKKSMAKPTLSTPSGSTVVPKPQKELPPSVLMVSSSGQGPGGIRIPFVVDDVPVVFDVPTNTITLPYSIEGMKQLQFDAKHAICIIEPNLQEFYIYYFDPDQPNAPPSKLLLKAKNASDFNKLVPDAIKMNWKTLFIGPDREVDVPKKPAKKLLKRMPSPKVAEAVPEVAPKSPVVETKPPPQEKPPNGDLFIVENKLLKLFETFNDEKPVLTLKAGDCISAADDDTQEFVIVYKEGTTEEETYVFNFDSKKIYEEKKQKLVENGFFQRKRQVVRDGEKRINQVCVVQKGRMDMYKHYGSPGDVPMLTMFESKSKAEAFKERREICLTQTKSNGKVEKATLDCSTAKEFDRWNVALLFGGFLKDVKSEDIEKMRGLSHLTKYIFPINLFGPSEDDPRCVRVQNDSVLIFPDPEATAPIFEFKKDETEILAELEFRRFRMFRNRFTAQEDRCDIIMHLASEFDRLEQILVREGFIQDVDPERKRRVIRSQARFVLAKKLILNIYSDKQATRASVFFRGLDYIGIAGSVVGDRRVIIRPRAEGEENTSLDAITEIDSGAQVASAEERLKMPSLTFEASTEDELKRWKFAFFIARMGLEYKSIPRFFIPSLIYGFNSQDVIITDVESKAKTGSFVGSFFKLRRGSRQNASQMNDFPSRIDQTRDFKKLQSNRTMKKQSTGIQKPSKIYPDDKKQGKGSNQSSPERLSPNSNMLKTKMKRPIKTPPRSDDPLLRR